MVTTLYVFIQGGLIWKEQAGSHLTVFLSGGQNKSFRFPLLKATSSCHYSPRIFAVEKSNIKLKPTLIILNTNLTASLRWYVYVQKTGIGT